MGLFGLIPSGRCTGYIVHVHFPSRPSADAEIAKIDFHVEVGAVIESWKGIGKEE